MVEGTATAGPAKRMAQLALAAVDRKRGQKYVERLLSDIDVMLEHAQRKGISIPDDTRDKIVELMKRVDLGDREEFPPISASSSDSQMSLAVDVHGGLSRLLVPATPDSIRASSIGGNRALQVVVGIGVLGVLLLLVGPLLGPWLERIGIPSDRTGGAQPWEFVRYFGAAAIGSSFYALYTATAYLRDGTFDPKYIETYIIRCVLGLFSGFILSNFPELLSPGWKQQPGNGYTLSCLTLALVGGFAADAVALILQRIADTLVTIVRGSGQERAEASAEKDKVKLKADIATQLQDVMTLDDSAKMQEQIKKIIAQAMK